MVGNRVDISLGDLITESGGTGESLRQYNTTFNGAFGKKTYTFLKPLDLRADS